MCAIPELVSCNSHAKGSSQPVSVRTQQDEWNSAAEIDLIHYIRKQVNASNVGASNSFQGVIGLITVFNPIFTISWARERLQCLYENLMSNNFLKTAVLKKNINCKLKLHSKGLFTNKVCGPLLYSNFSRPLL